MEKELSLSPEITKEIDGKCFRVSRIVGNISDKQHQIGDACLVEVKHDKVFGCFVDGSYLGKDCWMESEGTMLIRPDHIKSIVINGNGRMRQVVEQRRCDDGEDSTYCEGPRDLMGLLGSSRALRDSITSQPKDLKSLLRKR